MSIPPTPSTANSHRELRFARGVSATWWYTASGVIFWQAPLVLLWVMTLLAAGSSLESVAVVGIGGVIWIAATAPLVLGYRHRDADSPGIRWRDVWVPLTIGLVYGVAVLLVATTWVIAAVPVLQILVLLHWPRGVRFRVVAAATLVLIAAWIVDTYLRFGHLEGDDAMVWWLLGCFSIAMPPTTVLSLWWWDVLIALDRARGAEARLGATQERLRMATDVHDLQGHHLQVIALQLELAEKLMPKDPSASLEQLQAARASVDAARLETRELATQFRSVPLSDEIANAVDLLRAAGTSAEASLASNADHAPAEVLGPVIRETTTNVLRHGSGTWASLALARVGQVWRYEISNDRADGPSGADGPDASDGSGLQGIGRRAGEAGGSIEVRRGQGDFTVIVTVPVGGLS